MGLCEGVVDDNGDFEGAGGDMGLCEVGDRFSGLFESGDAEIWAALILAFGAIGRFRCASHRVALRAAARFIP